MSLNAYCADVKTLLSIDPNVRFIASLEGFFVCFVYLFVLFVLLVLFCCCGRFSTVTLSVTYVSTTCIANMH